MAYTRVVVNSGTTTLTAGETYTNPSVYSGDGGAAKVNGGTLVGESVAFTGNTVASGKNGGAVAIEAGGTATFEDSIFSNNAAGNVGGAFNNKGVLSFTGETASFSGNSAGTGGALRIYNGTVNFSAKETTFSGNSAGTGGAIYNNGGTINVAGIVTLASSSDLWVNAGISSTQKAVTNWDLTNAPLGNAVCINHFQYFRYSGNVDYTQRVISVNAAQTKGVYTLATDTGEMTGQKSFKLNGDTAITVGGSAVTLGDRNYLLAKNSANELVLTVYGNRFSVTSSLTLDEGATYVYPYVYSGDGGAGQVKGTGVLTGTNVTFAGNSATSNGGAIAIDAGGTATFENGVFSNNWAKNVGGAFNNKGLLNFTGSTAAFTGNSASDGGALRIYGGTVNFSAKETTFSGNSAGTSGAIYNQGGTINVSGVVNLATASDLWVNAGISSTQKAVTNWDLTDAQPGNSVCINHFQYVSSISNAQMLITIKAAQTLGDYTIATDAGNLSGQSFTLTGGEFSSQNITVGGAAVTGNGRQYTLAQSGTDLVLSIAYARFDVKDKTSLTLDEGATYTVAAASSMGGAGIVEAGGTLEGTGVTFASNSATNAGGAIDNSGTATFTNVTFSNNTATNFGGAINHKNGGILNFTGETASFTGNSASTGGALRIYNAAVNFRAQETTFSGNSAGTSGAIYNQGGTINVSGVVNLATASDLWVNAGISSTQKAVTNWDLTNAQPGDAVCINHFQYFRYSGNYTQMVITVAAEQSVGDYTIATDVGDLTGKRSFTLTGGDFSSQSITVDGTAVTGNGRQYTLAQKDADLVLSIAYTHFNVKNGTTLTLNEGATYTVAGVSTMGGAGNVEAGGTLTGAGVTFTGNTGSLGGAIDNRGTATFTNGTFSGNTATNTGGAINNVGGTVDFTGATTEFSNNTAKTEGGAVRNYSGTVNFNAARTVFNGNSSSAGGAIINRATLNIAGEIELCTTSDTIVTYSDITIDVDKFGSGDCYKVIDDTVAEEHSDLYTMNNGSKFVTDDETYSATIYDHDVYVYKNNGPFASAIITDGGTATSVVINGGTYTGVAYDFEHADKSKAFGASSVFYSGLTQTGNLRLASSTTGNATVGLKDSHVTGYVYGTQSGANIGGDFTFQIENTSIDNAASGNGRLYVGGEGTGSVSGTITANVVDSTLDVICATASDSGTVTAMVTNLTNSTVTKEVRGTGSAAKVTVGNVTINLTGSTVAKITGNYGNTVTGTVALNVTGATASTVNGAISKVDTITIDSGAELIVGNTVTMTTSLVNSGTLNWDLTKGSATNLDFSISDWSKVSGSGAKVVTVSATSQYGGNYALAAGVAGDFAITLKGLAQDYALSLNGTSSVTVDGIYYGLSKTLGTVSLLVAKVTEAETGTVTCCAGTATRITGGTADKMIFGGTISSTGDKVAITSNGTISIAGGTFGNSIACGSASKSDTQLSQEGDLDFTIEGGTFSGRVAGGMYVADGATSATPSTATATLDGNVKLTIKGGTFNGRIYGGCNAQKDAYGVQSTIEGSVSVTVDSSKNVIAINNYLIGGSRGATNKTAVGSGSITGDVTVTFTGLGDNLQFAKTSVVAGGCNGDYVKINAEGKRTTFSGVDGSRNLVFDKFTGGFGADLKLFSTATFKNGTKVAFNNASVNLWAVGTWNFEYGSSFSNLLANDFEDDTLNFDVTDLTTGSNWTVGSGAVAAFDDLMDAAAVNFGSIAATKDTENQCWTGSDTQYTYTLALNDDQNAMIVSKSVKQIA